MESEAKLEAFRLRMRMTILERIVLQNAFSAPVMSRRLSAQQSHQVLKEVLKKTSETADATYGAVLNDPALAGLYSDEVQDIVKTMEAIVDEMYEEWKNNPF